MLFAQGAVFVRRLNIQSSREKAQRRYAEAVRRALGVLIGGLCTVKGKTCAYVYGPADVDEAARLMYPDGLKLSVPQQVREARQAGALTWLGLRLKLVFLRNRTSAGELLK